jgi:hypothetical protein
VAVRDYPEIAFMPDPQVRPGVPTNHIDAFGNYCYERRPNAIVLAGDFHDLPSLSLWDSDATKAKEKRVFLSEDPDIEGDVEAGNRALRSLVKRVHGKSRAYKPRIILTQGNHEHRLTRFKQEYPHLGGALSFSQFAYEGIQVVPFLKPITLHGIAFSHFFCPDSNGRVMNTKRGQASARAQVLNVGMSAVAGHKQGLDVAVLERQSGRKRGIIAGSFYQHSEEYLGPQGNQHWQGALYMHEVNAGDFCLMELSLDYLVRRWS